MYRPRADGDPAARAAERTLVVGLTIFAAVLAAGGLLVVGQGLLRHHAAHRASQEVERALGLTPGERVAARLGAAAPAAVVAAVLAGAIGMAAGTLQPLGSQARFEPEPGFRAPWEVAVGGALVTALAFLALVAVAAATAGRRARGPARPARPRGSAWTALGPATLVGLRLAVRGHGRAVAVSAGAAVAVAGIVAALAFGSGIALLLSDPVRTGQAADLALEDAEEVDVAKLVGDPRVAALSVTRSVVARLADGGVLLVQAETQRKGEVPAGLVSGRMPLGPTEIALSPRIAAQQRPERRRHRHGGQPQRQAAPAHGDRHRRRRGRRAATSAPPTSSPTPRWAGSRARRRSCAPRSSPRRARRARSPPSWAATWRSCRGRPRPRCATSPTSRRCRRSSPRRSPSSRGRRWRTPSSPPRATTPGRWPCWPRSAPRPGRSAACWPCSAGRSSRPALVLGVPVGLATARLLWWQVATSIGVGGDLTPPVGLLTGTVAGVFAAALLLALVPGLRATRESAVIRRS